MANIKYKVCVLTVTYANRWQFLEQVLKRVLGFEQVTQVVVVDNASAYSVAANVTGLGDNRVTVLTNAQNEGSAGGYKKAIEYAYNNTGADMVWLLDDDNLPDEQALSGLLAKWEQINQPDDKKALYCLREDRLPHVKIARGENPARYYLVPDNFMGFSAFNILNNRKYKQQDRFGKNAPYQDKAMMPYVPYGGLLMHRALIKVIGYPDERFFVYVDDSEYTYRITQSGATIWLVPACKVIDIDMSQGINYQQKPFHSHLLDLWGFRNYYAVRNRMYFYSKVAVRSEATFNLNKRLYLAYLWLVSIISSKQKEYKKLVAAVNDGLAGKLGKVSADKY
ncbi:Glycosyltransferase, GT2 family [Mucilaginibacter pineti]|uniref:Glycosyltransferase, GT2 family n=1 Tax=Mucilaginibacter pineti TaxID=1391627 RepID=A0A1G7KEQ3_9SPHI|nr:glycosyltransferase [Mucilaginibacter pineti]SDF35510.1 Glycosyltransferase, GT2 family [Mucilaginibacter pineti]